MSPARAILARSTRLAASTLVLVCASAARTDDAPYFSERFGGTIERVVVAGGRIVIAGVTKTADLPASTSSPDPGTDANGPRDLFFVAALAPDGAPLWTSYAAGRGMYKPPSVRGLAVAPDGAVWIAGARHIDPVAALQPEPGGAGDAFIAKFSADGTLLFASDLGGDGDDYASGIAVLPDGDAVVTGSTSSHVFAGEGRPDDVQWYAYDAFVTRVRADGSGVVWTRRFGGPTFETEFLGGDVAVDPVDGSILAAMLGRTGDARAPFAVEVRAPRLRRALGRFRWFDSLVIRLGADGGQQEGFDLVSLVPETSTGYGPPHPRVPLLVHPDGALLSGGRNGVLRLPRNSATIQASDAHPDRRTIPSRMSAAPDGRVVVMESPTEEYGGAARIEALGTELAAELRPTNRAIETGFIPSDLAVDADGSLVVVGNGGGSAFGAAATSGSPAGWIARVPLDGARSPGRVRARVAGPREVNVAWSRDGDTAVRYEIERVPENAAPSVVATVPGNVFSLRVAGLTPGTHHDLRVVAVFASGVRSACARQTVTTPPVAPDRVVASDSPGDSVDVAWDDVNGDAVVWDVQRRFGDGDWMWTGDRSSIPWQRGIGSSVDRKSVADVVPQVAVPVTYRVRAVQDRNRSAWVESAPITFAPTLRVEQTTGSLATRSDYAVELVVTGTLAPAAGAGPLAFDPATQDLVLLFGDAAAPFRYVVESGRPGWTGSSGVFRWRAEQALSPWMNGSEIVLDLPRGEFVVRLASVGGAEPWFSRSVAIELSFGPYSGGDVREWSGRTGWAPSLSFGAGSVVASRRRR